MADLISPTKFAEGLKAEFSVRGRLFFVGNSTTVSYQGVVGADNANVGLSELQPFSTLDYAIGRTTAGRGDAIFILPGHAETILVAAGIALDMAGTCVYGLGTGNNRPVFTFTSTVDNAATWTMSGNNTKLKNVVLVCNDDGLTNGLVVSGDNCEVDIETQDTSAAIEFETAVRLDTANNCSLKIKHLGFTGGNAMVRLVGLDDCDNVRIDVDGFGIVSTAWINLVDVASTNVVGYGRLFTQGVTNGSRDIVDTIGGSSWFGRIDDLSAGAAYSGGSASAWATDDITALAAAIDAVDNMLDTEFPVVATAVGAVADAALADTIEGAAAATQSIVTDLKGVLQRIGADSGNNTAATTLVAINADGSVLERLEYVQDSQLVGGVDAVTNTQMSDVVGNKTDAAIADTIEGAAATTQSVVADVKAILQRIGADSANNTAATTLVADNRDGSILERTESIIATLLDDVASNFIGADNANNTAATTLVVSNADGSLLERAEFIQTDMLALPRCVVKTDGAVTGANDDLFNITGGPIIILSIVGIVTTDIGAAATNADLRLVTTSPAATVNLNSAPVAIETDAAGTSYTSVNTTGVFTPTTAGFVLFANSFATNETNYLAPAGTIHLRTSAGTTGVIAWYLRYIPLSPLSRVVAAA